MLLAAAPSPANTLAEENLDYREFISGISIRHRASSQEAAVVRHAVCAGSDCDGPCRSDWVLQPQPGDCHEAAGRRFYPPDFHDHHADDLLHRREGIAGMEDMGKVGRVGGKALLYFEIVSTLALVVGLVVGNLVPTGCGLNANATTLDSREVVA